MSEPVPALFERALEDGLEDDYPPEGVDWRWTDEYYDEWAQAEMAAQVRQEAEEGEALDLSLAHHMEVSA